MSKILFLVNHDVVIYNFRLELVERLLADGHQVVISSPYGERIEDLKALGCESHDIAKPRVFEWGEVFRHFHLSDALCRCKEEYSSRYAFEFLH